jgi:hypothetical protein
MPDSISKIHRNLRRRGFLTEVTRGSHIRITHPIRPGVVFTSSTPSGGRRADKNLESNLRKTFDEETGP